MRFRWIKTILMGTALVLVPTSLSNSFALAISNGPIADDDEKECEDEDEEDNQDKKRPKKHAKKDKHKAKGKKHKEHREPGQQWPGSQRPFHGPNRGPQRDPSHYMPFSWQTENRAPQFRGPGGPPSFMPSPQQRNHNRPNHQAEMVELLSSINRTLKNIESMMREEKNHPKAGERGMSGPSMHQGPHGPGQSWQPAQFVPQQGPPMKLYIQPQHGNDSFQPNNQQPFPPNLHPGQSWERRPEERFLEGGPPRERPPRESFRPERDDQIPGPRPDVPPRDGRGQELDGPNRPIEAVPSPSDSPR